MANAYRSQRTLLAAHDQLGRRPQDHPDRVEHEGRRVGCDDHRRRALEAAGTDEVGRVLDEEVVGVSRRHGSHGEVHTAVADRSEARTERSDRASGPLGEDVPSVGRPARSGVGGYHHVSERHVQTVAERVLTGVQPVRAVIVGIVDRFSAHEHVDAFDHAIGPGLRQGAREHPPPCCRARLAKVRPGGGRFEAAAHAAFEASAEDACGSPGSRVQRRRSLPPTHRHSSRLHAFWITGPVAPRAAAAAKAAWSGHDLCSPANVPRAAHGVAFVSDGLGFVASARFRSCD